MPTINPSKTTTETAVVLAAPTLRPVPRSPLNLHDVDAVRREMGKVYRDMRSERIESQLGTRLIYALSQIGKLIELSVIEKRIEALENPRRLMQPVEEATTNG